MDIRKRNENFNNEIEKFVSHLHEAYGGDKFFNVERELASKLASMRQEKAAAREAERPPLDGYLATLTAYACHFQALGLLKRANLIGALYEPR